MSDDYTTRMRALLEQEGHKVPDPVAEGSESGEPAKAANATEAPPVEEAAAVETPPAEPVKAEEGAPEPEPKKADDIDLAALPAAVRERLQAADKLAADLKSYQGRTGYLQRALNEKERLLAEARQGGVQSGRPAGAPSPTPAPQGAAPAPAVTPPATQESVLSQFESEDWQKLKREFPEFAQLETAVVAQHRELTTLRESLTAGAPAALLQRLESLETQVRASAQAAENARWSEFERKFNPGAHVFVDPDEIGRARGFKRMSPAFAAVWDAMSDEDRDAVNWNDPGDLTELFEKVNASVKPAATPETPASATPAPTAPPARDPASLAAAAAPAVRSLTSVARVPLSALPADEAFAARMRELLAQGVM